MSFRSSDRSSYSGSVSREGSSNVSKESVHASGSVVKQNESSAVSGSRPIARTASANPRGATSSRGGQSRSGSKDGSSRRTPSGRKKMQKTTSNVKCIPRVDYYRIASVFDNYSEELMKRKVQQEIAAAQGHENWLRERLRAWRRVAKRRRQGEVSRDAGRSTLAQADSSMVSSNEPTTERSAPEGVSAKKSGRSVESDGGQPQKKRRVIDTIVDEIELYDESGRKIESSDDVDNLSDINLSSDALAGGDEFGQPPATGDNQNPNDASQSAEDAALLEELDPASCLDFGGILSQFPALYELLSDSTPGKPDPESSDDGRSSTEAAHLFRLLCKDTVARELATPEMALIDETNLDKVDPQTANWKEETGSAASKTTPSSPPSSPRSRTASSSSSSSRPFNLPQHLRDPNLPTHSLTYTFSCCAVSHQYIALGTASGHLILLTRKGESVEKAVNAFNQQTRRRKQAELQLEKEISREQEKLKKKVADLLEGEEFRKFKEEQEKKRSDNAKSPSNFQPIDASPFATPSATPSASASEELDSDSTANFKDAETSPRSSREHESDASQKNQENQKNSEADEKQKLETRRIKVALRQGLRKIIQDAEDKILQAVQFFVTAKAHAQGQSHIFSYIKKIFRQRITCLGSNDVFVTVCSGCNVLVLDINGLFSTYRSKRRMVANAITSGVSGVTGAVSAAASGVAEVVAASGYAGSGTNLSSLGGSTPGANVSPRNGVGAAATASSPRTQCQPQSLSSTASSGSGAGAQNLNNLDLLDDRNFNMDGSFTNKEVTAGGLTALTSSGAQGSGTKNTSDASSSSKPQSMQLGGGTSFGAGQAAVSANSGSSQAGGNATGAASSNANSGSSNTASNANSSQAVSLVDVLGHQSIAWQFSVADNVLSVDMDPETGTVRPRLCLGTEKQFLVCRKHAVRKATIDEIHKGEGEVYNVRWNAMNLIAWTNTKGVKIYHVKSTQKVSYIPCTRKTTNGKIVAGQDPANILISWFDDYTLAISNTSELKLAKIRELPHSAATVSTKNQFYAEVVATVAMPGDQIICGITCDPRSYTDLLCLSRTKWWFEKGSNARLIMEEDEDDSGNQSDPLDVDSTVSDEISEEAGSNGGSDQDLKIVDESAEEDSSSEDDSSSDSEGQAGDSEENLDGVAGDGNAESNTKSTANSEDPSPADPLATDDFLLQGTDSSKDTHPQAPIKRGLKKALKKGKSLVRKLSGRSGKTSEAEKDGTDGENDTTPSEEQKQAEGAASQTDSLSSTTLSTSAPPSSARSSSLLRTPDSDSPEKIEYENRLSKSDEKRLQKEEKRLRREARRAGKEERKLERERRKEEREAERKREKEEEAGRKRAERVVRREKRRKEKLLEIEREKERRRQEKAEKLCILKQEPKLQIFHHIVNLKKKSIIYTDELHLNEVALRDPLERKYALDLTGNVGSDDISGKLLRDLDGVSIEQAMSGDESDGGRRSARSIEEFRGVLSGVTKDNQSVRPRTHAQQQLKFFAYERCPMKGNRGFGAEDGKNASATGDASSSAATSASGSSSTATRGTSVNSVSHNVSAPFQPAGKKQQSITLPSGALTTLNGSALGGDLRNRNTTNGSNAPIGPPGSDEPIQAGGEDLNASVSAAEKLEAFYYIATAKDLMLVSRRNVTDDAVFLAQEQRYEEAFQSLLEIGNTRQLPQMLRSALRVLLLDASSVSRAVDLVRMCEAVLNPESWQELILLFDEHKQVAAISADVPVASLDKVMYDLILQRMIRSPKKLMELLSLWPSHIYHSEVVIELLLAEVEMQEASGIKSRMIQRNIGVKLARTTTGQSNTSASVQESSEHADSLKKGNESQSDASLAKTLSSTSSTSQSLPVSSTEDLIREDDFVTTIKCLSMLYEHNGDAIKALDVLLRFRLENVFYMMRRLFSGTGSRTSTSRKNGVAGDLARTSSLSLPGGGSMSRRSFSFDGTLAVDATLSPAETEAAEIGDGLFSRDRRERTSTDSDLVRSRNNSVKSNGSNNGNGNYNNSKMTMQAKILAWVRGGLEFTGVSDNEANGGDTSPSGSKSPSGGSGKMDLDSSGPDSSGPDLHDYSAFSSNTVFGMLFHIDCYLMVTFLVDFYLELPPAEVVKRLQEEVVAQKNRVKEAKARRNLRAPDDQREAENSMFMTLDLNAEYWVHLYLQGVAKRDSTAAKEFTDKLIQSYADFEPEELMNCLVAAQEYDVQKAIGICRQKQLHDVEVYLLAKTGAMTQALDIILEKLNDVEKAVHFVAEQNANDPRMWSRLISYVVGHGDAFVHDFFKSIDPSMKIRPSNILKEVVALKGGKKAIRKVDSLKLVKFDDDEEEDNWLRMEEMRDGEEDGPDGEADGDAEEDEQNANDREEEKAERIEEDVDEQKDGEEKEEEGDTEKEETIAGDAEEKLKVPPSPAKTDGSPGSRGSRSSAKKSSSKATSEAHTPREETSTKRKVVITTPKSRSVRNSRSESPSSVTSGSSHGSGRRLRSPLPESDQKKIPKKPSSRVLTNSMYELLKNYELYKSLHISCTELAESECQHYSYERQHRRRGGLVVPEVDRLVGDVLGDTSKLNPNGKMFSSEFGVETDTFGGTSDGLNHGLESGAGAGSGNTNSAGQIYEAPMSGNEGSTASAFGISSLSSGNPRPLRTFQEVLEESRRRWGDPAANARSSRQTKTQSGALTPRRARTPPRNDDRRRSGQQRDAASPSGRARDRGARSGSTASTKERSVDNSDFLGGSGDDAGDYNQASSSPRPDSPRSMLSGGSGAQRNSAYGSSPTSPRSSVSGSPEGTPRERTYSTSLGWLNDTRRWDSEANAYRSANASSPQRASASSAGQIPQRRSSWSAYGGDSNAYGGRRLSGAGNFGPGPAAQPGVYNHVYGRFKSYPHFVAAMRVRYTQSLRDEESGYGSSGSGVDYQRVRRLPTLEERLRTTKVTFERIFGPQIEGDPADRHLDPSSPGSSGAGSGSSRTPRSRGPFSDLSDSSDYPNAEFVGRRKRRGNGSKSGRSRSPLADSRASGSFYVSPTRRVHQTSDVPPEYRPAGGNQSTQSENASVLSDLRAAQAATRARVSDAARLNPFNFSAVVRRRTDDDDDSDKDSFQGDNDD